MNEVPTLHARDWVEFVDPENPDEIYKCDLTWLTSNWSCIYGNGCKGIDKEHPDSGCCSDGAYYTDKEDEQRTDIVAKRLTREMWQFYDEAQPKNKNGKLKISEVGLDKDRKTRKVQGSCIFLNRRGHVAPDYTGEMGCVLHHLAAKEGVHFSKIKPDVCWQLPMRRSFEKREVGEQEISVTVIGEYERAAWGDGGLEFDWYCTDNPEAHIGKQPVYISNSEELKAMMSESAYKILKQHCDNRMELIAISAKANKKRLLPLLQIHPATQAAQVKR
jgi:hypothetical protein